MSIVSGIDPEKVLVALLGQSGFRSSCRNTGKITATICLHGSLGNMAHGRSNNTIHQFVRTEFLGNIESLGRIHCIVSHDMFYFNALNATLLIPLIHGNLAGIENLHARCGSIPREGAGVPNIDTFGYIPTKTDLE